jgi:hypothetical protein
MVLDFACKPPNLPCHPARTIVILSEAKDLALAAIIILPGQLSS